MYSIYVGKNGDKWSWCVISGRKPILFSNLYSSKANAQRAADEFMGRMQGKIKMRGEK